MNSHPYSYVKMPLQILVHHHSLNFRKKLGIQIITSLTKEVMFLVALVSLSVCLFVCLFVCGQHYSKSYERIGMKFYGRVLSSTRKN